LSANLEIVKVTDLDLSLYGKWYSNGGCNVEDNRCDDDRNGDVNHDE